MGLAAGGMDRQEAHELVRRVAIAGQDAQRPFREALLANEEICSRLSPEEIDSLLDPRRYMGRSGEIVEDILGKYGTSREKS